MLSRPPDSPSGATRLRDCPALQVSYMSTPDRGAGQRLSRGLTHRHRAAAPTQIAKRDPFGSALDSPTCEGQCLRRPWGQSMCDSKEAPMGRRTLVVAVIATTVGA